MFRLFKVTGIIMHEHKFASVLILILTFITTVSMPWVLPVTLIGRARHAAWTGSGLHNAAFFTRDYRFDWYGFDHVPPAYHKLMKTLNDMNGCTAVSVDYCDLYLPDNPEPIVLCIYPEILRERIQTPLGEGTFESASGDEGVKLVLDSRLNKTYAVGDIIPIRCAWQDQASHELEATAMITGFLTPDNDHISTLGGSNTKALRYFATKAFGDDPYVALTTSGSVFEGKAYTGHCTSILLLPPKSQSANLYLDEWRREIAKWNLGQIDSYQDIYESDLWDMAVVANIDFYLLTAWLMALTIAGLIGYNLMRTDTLRRRLALFGMLGMTKRQMLSCIAIGEYAPFWCANISGLIVGNALAATVYRDYSLVANQVAVATLLVTMLPHLIALYVDGCRIMRMGELLEWNARR